jgi:hypothetical protein
MDDGSKICLCVEIDAKEVKRNIHFMFNHFFNKAQSEV